MPDYLSWKVTDLKAELKRRRIPQTGLRVKQNFIDKLVEDDAKQQNESANGELESSQDVSGDAQQTTGQPANEPSQPEEQQPQVTVPESEGHKEEKEQEQVQEQEAQELEVEKTETKPEPVEEPKGDEGMEKRLEETPQQTLPEEPSDEAQNDQAKSADIVDETAAPSPHPQTEIEHPAKPVEQAPGDAEAVQPSPAEPGAEEESDSADKIAALPTAATTELSTPLPVDEIIEDSRKRKRRSESPIPTPDVVAVKKAKAQEEPPRVILPEDRDAMDVEERSQKDTAAPAPEDPSAERPDNQTADERIAAKDQGLRRTSISDDVHTKGGVPIKQDARFKGLFAAAEGEQVRPASPAVDTAMDNIEVEPALHDATAALYIDGLMRPLQPLALRNHLVSIATAPGAPPDSDVIVDFYLDTIKTHCFVNFADISAASRARSALHKTVWPNERNRKSLFVDFIPEQKMQQWVAREEESRMRGGPPARWEVKYDRTDGGVEAFLQEVDTKSAMSRQAPGRATTDFSRPPPTGPRASISNMDRRVSGPPPPAPHPRPGQGFKPLDDLFESTKTKPKLYYLPVPREVADRRLDRFDDLLRKGAYPRRGGDENRRITFEDEDLFVDQGPEYGGRSNRRPRGRGRGGGMRDSWRDDRDRRGRD